ncbi:Signal transduction histidine kinase [Lachnospiraceae bacterium]|nr:Signal transduction histidine kinase [Lachnospiraceae bacterium]
MTGKNRTLAQHSIRTQFALIFIALMAVTISIFWIINSLFLQKYYLIEQQNKLTEGYESINELFVTDSNMEASSSKRKFYRICSSLNMDVAVVTTSLETVICNVGEGDALLGRLMDHLFDIDDERLEMLLPSENRAPGEPGKGIGPDGKPVHVIAPRLLVKTDQYKVMISQDPRMGMGYLELWGNLTNGDIIIIRTTLDSIRESAGISNRFLAYVGLFMVILAGTIIWFVTKKITEPIRELTDISERMTNLDFDAKYTGGGHNEIALLGQHMNVLSEALERTISELKTANNELKRDIEKKEKLNTMRLEFLSNVAHELKTPIALVQGYAEGLKDNVNDDADSREFYCDVIIDEAGKMNKLVKNLMTLNQLEFGEDEVSMERFDVVELIRGCIQSNHLMLEQNNIRLDFLEHGPLYVWSDEFKTEEVFTNYFSNAIHYCSEPADAINGEFSEKRIEVKLFRHDGVVRISVFNTGDPIPEESISHLFDKFYKVDKARTREYGGSGIGLSIVKAIMNALNRDFGVINYENGVEFWFELDCEVREN